MIILSSSVETLLPSPDSAFQLGDFFPMVKVTIVISELRKYFLIIKTKDKN